MIRNLLLSSLVCLSLIAQAQKKDQSVLKIGKQSFSLKEFEYIYNKNNPVSQKPMSKEQYLDLFVNYKLKVKAAEDAGLDTMASFVSELQYYRNELAKPYLSDKKAEEHVLAEAYARMQYELDASHILIMVKGDASPKDTLAAWNKVKQAHDEISNGADFNQVAMRYSEDPSVQRNSGRLGYFSAFQMVYPFETGAYQTTVGGVSSIVRSPYGYHLIKIHDKRPASGEIQVAHIMKMLPQNATAAQVGEARIAIDSVYQKVLAGDDFSSLATEYSDDKQSAYQGGELPWFSKGRMVASFADVAFGLAGNGDVSQPFRTPFGWHIVKRLDYKPLGSFDQERDNIMQHLSNDERSLAGVKALVASLKQSYNFRVDSMLLNGLLDLFEKESNDSLLLSKALGLSGTLFSFAGTNVDVNSFVAVLKDGQMLKAGVARLQVLDNLERFEEKSVLDYEKSVLEKKYPDYRFLMQEYHDGLLVFEISQRMVWEKASSDTTALMDYYRKNIQRYSKPGSFQGNVVVCRNVKEANALKNRLESAKPLSMDQIKRLAGTDAEIFHGSFSHGEDAAMDALLWPADLTSNPLVVLNGSFENGDAIPFESIRGSVISDYQVYLEEAWMKQLHQRYQPKVFRKAVK